jgi:hypothetical protein
MRMSARRIPTSRAIRPKQSATSDLTAKHPTSISLDEMARVNCQHLCYIYEMNMVEVLDARISSTLDSDRLCEEFQEFVRTKWSQRVDTYHGSLSKKRINLEPGLSYKIESIGRLIGHISRSEVVRIVLAFWAYKEGLLKFTR